MSWRSNKNPMFRSQWSETIFNQKYSQNGKYSWAELCQVLVNDVCGTGSDGKLEPLVDKDTTDAMVKAMCDLKFIPGGRYLYYAGRSAHYYNNCFLLRAEEDTREDWAMLSYKAEMCLTTGGGIGVDYTRYRCSGSPLKRTGGTASGPIPKIEMTNEQGRKVRQGGSRRSAMYASLNWKHGDAHKFIVSKDWHSMPIPGTDKTFWDAKQADYNFPCPLDHTNISLNYDTEWLTGYWRTGDVGDTFKDNVRQAMKTGEPGFSFNFFAKENETLRNAPVSADTEVLTIEGYKSIRDLIDTPVLIWTGRRWSKTVFTRTGIDIQTVIVKMSNQKFIKADPTHEFIIREDMTTKRIQAQYLMKHDALYNRDINGNEEDIYVVSVTEGPTEDVYCCDVGVPEHSFMAEGVIISNCTEVCSEDDSDVCNLGSINIGRIDSIDEFKDIIQLAVTFILCGTLRADLPYEKVREVRTKNRRLGLGLMGVHEFLLKRNQRYEVSEEFHRWLTVYQQYSDEVSAKTADHMGISRPVAVRAVAPTGTIGIIAGTSTGIEPIFAVAYKRRYVDDDIWKYQYVIDGVAQELIDTYGVDPNSIESSIDLAADPKRRIAFQAHIQGYVDQSISSTINLPYWGSDLNNEDKVEEMAQYIAKYANRLRGVTLYPDGARGGQPLEAVDYATATSNKGETFIEAHDICKISGRGGTCGS